MRVVHTSLIGVPHQLQVPNTGS